VLHEARCKYRTQQRRQKSPSGHHRTALSDYRPIFANKARIDNRKKLLCSNTSSTCPYNMVNFGPLVAEILSLVWGTPANVNGFRVLASFLQRRRSTEVNQILHYVWPSPGLVHYIGLYTFGISCLLTEFLPRAKFTFCPSTHHCTSFSGYIFATKASIDNRKKLTKQRYVVQVYPQYGELWPTSG